MKTILERKTKFRWNTKKELFTYFKEKHNLNHEQMEKVIEKTLKNFRPRKNQIIKTQELWEKVGQEIMHAKIIEI